MNANSVRTAAVATAPVMSSHLELLDGDDHGLEQHLVAAGGQLADLHLRGPALEEVEPADLAVREVVEDDRAVLARLVDLAVLDLLDPVPERLVVDLAPGQVDVLVLH